MNFSSAVFFHLAVSFLFGSRRSVRLSRGGGRFASDLILWFLAASLSLKDLTFDICVVLKKKVVVVDMKDD